METPHISDTSRFWPVPNCLNFLLINLNSPARDNVPKKHDTFFTEVTLCEFPIQLRISQSFKHNSKMLHMIIKGLAIHQDIIKIYYNKQPDILPQNMIHKPHK